MTPAVVSAVGGDVVTVTGAGFTPEAAVTFGGTPAVAVDVVSPTTLTVTVPSHPAGQAPLVVTTPDGASTPVDFAFALEETTTSVTAQPSRVVRGHGLLVGAQVAAGHGTPAGTVSFSVDGRRATHVPLVGGYAEMAWPTLPVGAHTVSVTYGGDGVYAASSGSVDVVVAPIGCTKAHTCGAPGCTRAPHAHHGRTSAGDPRRNVRCPPR